MMMKIIISTILLYHKIVTSEAVKLKYNITIHQYTECDVTVECINGALLQAFVPTEGKT